MISARTLFTLMALGCAALLGYGYYLEYGAGQEPCPLCILQRLAFFCVLIVSGIAALHNPSRTGARVYAGLVLLAAMAGGGVAARQVWLQHLPPDQLPECGPGLEYMLEVFPLFEALRMVLTGSGECAEVGWTFLGLSIAEWSLCAFVGLALIALYIFIRARRITPQRIQLFR